MNPHLCTRMLKTYVRIWQKSRCELTTRNEVKVVTFNEVWKFLIAKQCFTSFSEHSCSACGTLKNINIIYNLIAEKRFNNL